MNSESKSDPALDTVRALPWNEDPVPNRTTSIVNTGIPTINLTFSPLSKDPNVDQSLKDLGQVLSEETVEELTKYEDQVFTLLTQDPSKAIHLLTDPINALQDLGVKLSPSASSELRNVRQKLITPQLLEALTTIKQLSVKVDTEGGGK